MLVIENLQVSYDKGSVLKFPDISLSRGAKCLLKGPSGSGKSTLLNTIAGFGPYQSGALFINNTSLYDLDGPKRDHFRGVNIGYVFQTFQLLKPFNVIENILLPTFASGSSPQYELAIELLERVGLKDFGMKRVTELSQGQCQRVAIARALIHKPLLLLADEPTSGLDDLAAQDVIELIRDFSNLFDMTLMVASHDQRIFEHFDCSIELGGKHV